MLPVIGAIVCAYLVTPLSGRAATQYVLGGGVLVLGLVLFGVTLLINRRLGVKPEGLGDAKELQG